MVRTALKLVEAQRSIEGKTVLMCNSTGKHAYLIVCHTNFDQLCILLDLLDDERNDIFLHIDKKASNYSRDQISAHATKSKLFFVNPMKVSWGGDSLIKAELKLLAEATKTPHDYYHLLSGMDLPLKPQDEIHAFFSQHAGYDFVSLERTHPHNITKSYMYRLRYYYLFQNHITRGSNGFLSKLQKMHIQIQKMLKIDRTKNANIAFQKGSEWFSIRHNTACYVLREYKKYKKYFRYSECGDEWFLQTILMHSPFISEVVDSNMRYTDWNRGCPYTFRLEDYNLLMDSGKLFARKFDIKVDADIIDRIRDTILSKQMAPQTD